MSLILCSKDTLVMKWIVNGQVKGNSEWPQKRTVWFVAQLLEIKWHSNRHFSSFQWNFQNLLTNVTKWHFVWGLILNFRKKSKMNFLNTALYARSCAKMDAQSKLTECPYFARVESVPKPIGRDYMTRTWNGKLPVCVFWAKIRNAHEMSLSSDYHCN